MWVRLWGSGAGVDQWMKWWARKWVSLSHLQPSEVIHQFRQFSSPQGLVCLITYIPPTKPLQLYGAGVDESGEAEGWPDHWLWWCCCGWVVGWPQVGASCQGPVVVKCCLGLKCIRRLKRKQELWFEFHTYYNSFLPRSFPWHLIQQC